MNENHRELRELIGPYVLGHLDAEESGRLRSHLESCPACRDEVNELAPLAGLLAAIDPAALVRSEPEPAPQLAERIRAAVAQERDVVEPEHVVRLPGPRGQHPHRAPRGWTGLAGAVALAAAVLGAVLVGGFVWGQASVGEVAAVPREVISMSTTSDSGIVVDEAFLVNHTWGVELRIDATGFAAGDEFTAVFRRADGSEIASAEFLGVGGKPMLCNLQSAVLREDLVGIAVTDETGEVVAQATL